MYYNNPTATTTTSSSTQVFVASDDFEDNNITEYSGETAKFSTISSRQYDGTYSLDNPTDTDRSVAGGIYRTDQLVSQGETFRYLQYIDTTGTTDEICTKFGVSTTSPPNANYAVCVEFPGNDRISIVKDARENDSQASAVVLSTVEKNGLFTTGWYEFEVDWGIDDSIFVTTYDPSGAVFATTSATDSTYTSGGYGFSFWFNKGGWDSISSRPTLTNEPTVYFGDEQADGGATWREVQNTTGVYDVSETARLRVGVENTGLAITGQEFRLEYAELGASPSCEAVSPNDFVTVPPQATCGTSPVCMDSTLNYTNGASTVDLLFGMTGQFTAGRAIESPSNTTVGFDIGQNQYTEIEYAITPTTNVTDENLCFRVTDAGVDYDTYLQVAKMQLRFDPVVTNVTLNDGVDIVLTPGATATITASSTVSDYNGVADLDSATTTFYTTDVGAMCTPNDNNCYVATSSCSFTNCSGTSCTLLCSAPFAFHADPTDNDGAQEWFAFVEVSDLASGVGFDTSIAMNF